MFCRFPFWCLNFIWMPWTLNIKEDISLLMQIQPDAIHNRRKPHSILSVFSAMRLRFIHFLSVFLHYLLWMCAGVLKTHKYGIVRAADNDTFKNIFTIWSCAFVLIFFFIYLYLFFSLCVCIISYFHFQVNDRRRCKPAHPPTKWTNITLRIHFYSALSLVFATYSETIIRVYYFIPSMNLI